MKKRLLIPAIVLMSAIIYSFGTSKNDYKYSNNINYKTLSANEKIHFENKLISKLKKDSSFIIYDEISNIQAEALMGTTASKENFKKLTNVPNSNLVGELTNHYKGLGIENAEAYAKLDIVKKAILASLAKKYPEFQTMDINAKSKILLTAKRPLKEQDFLRRKAIIKKTIDKGARKIEK